MISWSFLLTSIVVVVIPGTGVMYTVSTGLTGSRKSALLAALGCTLGIVPHLIAGIAGISALLHTTARVFQIIKLLGIIYLVYLGCSLLFDKEGIAISTAEGVPERKGLKIVSRAVLINLLNPKLTMFFFSFLPQFITDPESHYVSQMIIMSIIFMGLTLLIFSLYALLAHGLKSLFLHSPRISRRIQQCLGVVLIASAVKLAFTEE